MSDDKNKEYNKEELLKIIHEAKENKTKCLDLSNGKISKLPLEIGLLTELEELNLSNNYNLRLLPKELFLLVKLKKIDLRNTELVIFPYNLRKLESIEIIDLSNSAFLGHNLSGIILSPNCLLNKYNKPIKYILKNVHFEITKFYNANLSGLDFENSTFTNEYLKGANFEDANLQGVSFETYDIFRGYPIVYMMNFENINFENAILNNTNLSHRVFSDCNFKNASLYKANLKGASLKGNEFYGVNFEFANLSHANFTNTLVVEANLNNANLNSAHLSGTSFEGSSMVGANITNVIFDFKTSFKNVVFVAESNAKTRIDKIILDKLKSVGYTSEDFKEMDVVDDLATLRLKLTGFSGKVYLFFLSIFLFPYIIFIGSKFVQHIIFETMKEGSYKIDNYTAKINNKVVKFSKGINDSFEIIEDSFDYLKKKIPKNKKILLKTTNNGSEAAKKIKISTKRFFQELRIPAINKKINKMDKKPLYIHFINKVIRQSWLGIVAFFYMLLYHIIRLCLVIFTYTLERKKEVRELEIDFSFHKYKKIHILFIAMFGNERIYYKILNDTKFVFTNIFDLFKFFITFLLWIFIFIFNMMNAFFSTKYLIDYNKILYKEISKNNSFLLTINKVIKSIFKFFIEKLISLTGMNYIMTGIHVYSFSTMLMY